jgi:predicted nuclease of predicted toxin-antitoxin system
VRFFFDNNLPPRLARSLHILVGPEHEVIHLKEKFAADTSDEAWMRSLAKELDWVIISADTRITRLDSFLVLDSGLQICEMFS